MTETKCFRDAFRDQLHELSGQSNMKVKVSSFSSFEFSVFCFSIFLLFDIFIIGYFYIRHSYFRHLYRDVIQENNQNKSCSSKNRNTCFSTYGHGNSNRSSYSNAGCKHFWDNKKKSMWALPKNESR